MTHSKNLYLLFRDTYDHQIWQTSTLQWEELTFKVTWPVETWSRDKLKHLYMHFHNTYGHQTWQGGNLPLEDPAYLVRWPFDNVATWQIQEIYICSSAILMTTKLGRVVACSGGTPTSKSRALLITWSREKFKKLISALPQYLWPPNLVE